MGIETLELLTRSVHAESCYTDLSPTSLSRTHNGSLTGQLQASQRSYHTLQLLTREYRNQSGWIGRVRDNLEPVRITCQD